MTQTAGSKSSKPDTFFTLLRKAFDPIFSGWPLRKVFLGLTGLAILVAMVGIGAAPDKGAGLLGFFLEALGFFGQILIIITLVLIVNYFVQFFRTRQWYDRFGAARELLHIQGRIGTSKEKLGDNTAMGYQFLANTVLLAVMVLSFFLLHS